MSNRHLTKHKKEYQRTTKVECTTFDTIAKTYKLNDIDIVTIDTEGSEIEILKAINFDEINIGIFVIESVHIKNKELHKILTSHNYYLEKEFLQNQFWIKNEYLEKKGFLLKGPIAKTHWQTFFIPPTIQKTVLNIVKSFRSNTKINLPNFQYFDPS